MEKVRVQKIFKKPYSNFHHIGKRLAQLRSEFEIGKADFASRLKLQETKTVNSIESGNSTVNAVRAIQLFMEEYNINPAWILKEDNSQQPKYLLTEGASIKSLQEENQILREEIENLISRLDEKGIKLMFDRTNTQILIPSQQEITK